MYRGQKYQRISLPSYPFDREYYFVENNLNHLATSEEVQIENIVQTHNQKQKQLLEKQWMKSETDEQVIDSKKEQ
ncbi:hypothetical protein AAAC51_24130 [Priestia megaterium]